MAKIIEIIPEKIPTDIINNRREICEKCEFKQGEMCSPCNCLIEAKVYAFCPKEKW